MSETERQTVNQTLNIYSAISGILLCCILSINPADPLAEQSAQQDALIYSVTTDGTGEALWHYAPHTKTNSQLYNHEKSLAFEVSPTGMVAFSTPWTWKNNGGLHLLDTTATQPPPISISQQIGLSGYPLAWSRDGQYLAFASWQAENNLLLYIWNGETAINITPDSGNQTIETFQDVEWSYDGRLTFTVWYEDSTPEEDFPTEIFLWTGITTINLSLNPTGGDHAATWNQNNEVAFFTSVNNEYRIVVWDGVSYQDNHPDTASFVTIAPDLPHYYYSYPVWTSDGKIAFAVQLPGDHHVQIYRWDGENAINISQNPDSHNGGAVWSNDGYWAFVTYFSSEQVIFIRDRDNNTLLKTRGEYRPAWSSTNALAFCRFDRTPGTSGWILSVWDESGLTEIAQGREIYARWQSGQKTACSSG